MSPPMYMLYNRTSCLECIKFITEDAKAKHTNITTICKAN